MYFIWILIGMPIASLLCAAFIAMRDGKTRPANTGVHRTDPVSSVTALSKATKAGDWKSESAVQVLIGILSKPSDDGFRVTYVAKSDDNPWTRSESEDWALRCCTGLPLIDKDFSPTEVGPTKGGSGNQSSDSN
jgi:hypothetical protein